MHLLTAVTTLQLRCSGDQDCCRRCSRKKFLCEYPSPPRSSGHNKEISSSRPQTIPETVARNSPVEVEFPCDIPYRESLPDTIHDFDIPCLPTPGATGSLVDDNSNKDISMEIDAFWEKHHTPTTDRNHSYGSVPTDIDDVVFESSASLVTLTPPDSNAPSPPRCTCLHQAMTTNEAIEVTMWEQKEPSSDIYDILQQQKATLVKVEDLLECRTCCIQPPFVMLILSMCRKLLATLDKICRESRGREDCGSSTSSDVGAERRKRRKSSYEGSREVESRRGYGISIRERRLDDDDENLVLQSLVTMRIKMLRRILDRIDKVASQHSWPVHKGVCRELQISLHAGSFT